MIPEAWEHQKLAVRDAPKHQGYQLFWQMGTGKSRGAIDIVRRMMNIKGRLRRTLVFGPPVVVPNWVREFNKFAPKIPKPVALLGPVKKRILALEDVSGIAVTPYTSLLNPAFVKAALEWGPEIIIWDEIHRLKNPSAKTHKAAWKLAQQADFRLGLTGTPILNSPMDLFGIYKVVDMGATFGTTLTAFRSKYFYDKNAGMPRHKYFPDWRPKPSIEGEMNERIALRSSHVKKDECLDLPPLVKVTVDVELSKEQQRLYNEMKRDFVTFVENKRGEPMASVASQVIVKALRLMQITTGHIVVEDETGNEREVHHIEGKNPRQEALRDLLSEIGGTSKVIVWAVWRANYADIRSVCDDLGLGYVELHGDVSATKRQPNIDAFNDDPAVRVLIGHPGSGGIGVNLVASDYSIFYSRNFSLENDLQAEARNHRGGSEIYQRVTRVDLVAQGTIDESVVEALTAKQNISEKILELKV